VSNKTNIKDVVLAVLEKHKDMEVNLASEAAREKIAEDISNEIADWIRTLWKEDFEV